MTVVSCGELTVDKTQTNPQALDIQSVPKEIVLLFFSYLNAQELCVVSCVQKQWCLLAKTEDLWKRLVTRNLGFEIKLNVEQYPTWKENYQGFLDVFIVRKIAISEKEKDSEYIEVSKQLSEVPHYDLLDKSFYAEKLKGIEMRISLNILSLIEKMSADFKEKHFKLTELASSTENYPYKMVSFAKGIMIGISLFENKKLL